MEYTYEQKVEMYRAGAYSFPVPPVSTAYWTMDSWIKYIDNNGRWLGL